jgi:hypothetical protein
MRGIRKPNVGEVFKSKEEPWWVLKSTSGKNNSPLHQRPSHPKKAVLCGKNSEKRKLKGSKWQRNRICITQFEDI